MIFQSFKTLKSNKGSHQGPPQVKCRFLISSISCELCCNMNYNISQKMLEIKNQHLVLNTIVKNNLKCLNYLPPNHNPLIFFQKLKKGRFNLPNISFCCLGTIRISTYSFWSRTPRAHIFISNVTGDISIFSGLLTRELLFCMGRIPHSVHVKYQTA